MCNDAPFYRRCGKRIFDILVSAVALVVLAPVLLLVAVLVRSFLGSPILFRQRRIGLGEKEFSVLKFRTMTNKRDSYGALLPDQQRVTGFGHFLRTASLNVLPQLWNVLVGDMSLVGPRPLYPNLPYNTQRESLRHTVLPGITGLAKVSGHNLISWDDRLELDALYVERQSFFCDLALLVRTLREVVKMSGVALQTVDDLDAVRSSPCPKL